jgi:hypothetical protein
MALATIILAAAAAALIIAYVVKRHRQARAAASARWEANIAKLPITLCVQSEIGEFKVRDMGDV